MIFQVQNGSFGYHHKNILNQISFEVTDGNVLAVLGPNGVGKTTLLNITTCIHCMKCINLCPMHVFEIKEYDNSRIILPTGESNCIQCQTCSRNCPTNSIFINESFINGIRIAIREAGSDKLQQAYRYY